MKEAKKYVNARNVVNFVVKNYLKNLLEMFFQEDTFILEINHTNATTAGCHFHKEVHKPFEFGEIISMLVTKKFKES